MDDSGTSTTAPAVKAAGINSLVAVLRAMSSPEKFAVFERQLPARIAAVVSKPRMAQEWIPLEDVAGIYAAAVADLFDGDTARLYEVGRQQVRNDLTGIYRVFLRVVSPAFIATRSSALYEVYGRDTGTVRVQNVTANSLELVVADRPSPSPAFFEVLRGFIGGALELTGVKDFTITVIDATKPDGRTFLARWR